MASLSVDDQVCCLLSVTEKASGAFGEVVTCLQLHFLFSHLKMKPTLIFNDVSLLVYCFLSYKQ